MRYEFDAPIVAAALADLRQSVGWNRMERELADAQLHNAFQLCCFDGDQLIGYEKASAAYTAEVLLYRMVISPDMELTLPPTTGPTPSQW